MRKRIRGFVLTAALMLLLPMTARLFPRMQKTAQTAHTVADSLSAAPDGTYRVLITETGEVKEVSVRDYLIGAVGAEMPASYEPEALKAQAVASHTYAERIRMQNAAHPDKSLCGADFSDDSRKYQAFFTEEQLRTFYGADADSAYAAIAAAVDAAGGLLLYYADEPIAAAFHAVSSGETANAEDVFGTALPYLVTVPSAWDSDAPQFAETVKLAPDAVKKALMQHTPAPALPDDPAAWFTVLETGDAGTVLRVRAGDTVMNGQTLRSLLGLRSACFTVSVSEGMFCFETKGNGHGVGMSQFGAHAMAASGSSFAEILAHYYPGTELRERAAP